MLGIDTESASNRTTSQWKGGVKVLTLCRKTVVAYLSPLRHEEVSVWVHLARSLSMLTQVISLNPSRPNPSNRRPGNTRYCPRCLSTSCTISLTPFQPSTPATASLCPHCSNSADDGITGLNPSRVQAPASASVPTHLEPVPRRLLLLLLLVLLCCKRRADCAVVLHNSCLLELPQLATAVGHCQQHQAKAQAAAKGGKARCSCCYSTCLCHVLLLEYLSCRAIITEISQHQY